MPAYLAFLRAVNVGGRQTPMAEVREALDAAGFGEVATHIQTGNVRVTSTLRSPAAVAARVRSALTTRFGFDVPAVVRRPGELTALVEAIHGLPDPYPQGRSYVAFLSAAPSPEATAELDAWDVPGEFVRVVGDHVVYRLGVSFHEAKFSNARVERAGVLATTRDLRVVRAVAERWG